AAPVTGVKLDGARVAIEGWGNVGRNLGHFLHEMGCRIVAASDATGAVYNPRGLDPTALSRYKQETGSVAGFPSAETITGADLFAVDCDILAPCALSGVITRANAHRITAKMVVEGANGPTTPDGDEILAERGIYVVPDVLANAGGVTVSYFEWVQDLQAF